MKPDILNAVGMISMVAFTAGVLFFCRIKPIRSVSWKRRIPLAIGTCFFALLLFSMHTKMCVEIPEPFGQFELTALSLLLIVTLVDKKPIILVSCVVIVLAGSRLQMHFDEIVRYSNDYTTIDANTHKPMAKGCSEMKTSDGIVPEHLWHT
jgi:hypothetical protein